MEVHLATSHGPRYVGHDGWHMLGSGGIRSLSARTLYAGLSGTQCAPTEPSHRPCREIYDSNTNRGAESRSIQFNPDPASASFLCDADSSTRSSNVVMQTGTLLRRGGRGTEGDSGPESVEPLQRLLIERPVQHTHQHQRCQASGSSIRSRIHARVPGRGLGRELPGAHGLRGIIRSMYGSVRRRRTASESKTSSRRRTAPTHCPSGTQPDSLSRMLSQIKSSARLLLSHVYTTDG
jgi:hypothetical protein